VRLPAEKALVNRLGFPSRGSAYVKQRLGGKRPADVLLGANLGKNKDTPLESAGADYLELLELCAALADYLVVNVSSPNTVGLRRLQARQALEELLTQLAQRKQALGCAPLLVKLAPDLTDAELDDALQAVLATGMDGVIAANTTTSREGIPSQALRRSTWAASAGGMSGLPVRHMSTEMVRKIYARTAGKLPIIGVGGVMGWQDAREKLDAGATLVQVYTGLVYRGPGLVKDILQHL
jgi:dihydroorotate dehydrogenase